MQVTDRGSPDTAAGDGVMSVECWDGLITWHKVILTFETNSKVNYFVSTNVVDQTYIYCERIGHFAAKMKQCGLKRVKK